VINLVKTVNQYFKHRCYKDPTAEEAMLFLVSEVGELADLVVSNKQEWVRNNPDRQRDLIHEIGDVQMMLIKTAEKLGVENTVAAMVQTMYYKSAVRGNTVSLDLLNESEEWLTSNATQTE
jgi:NTP pyrophosphatase (non-canonical NTP hydrolase)